MKLENLTPEQLEKAKACKTPQEILDLVKEEGLELTEDELDTVAGGEGFWTGKNCPKCGSERTMMAWQENGKMDPNIRVCVDCEHEFTVAQG